MVVRREVYIPGMDIGGYVKPTAAMYGSVAFLFFSFLAAASAQASTSVSVTGTAGGSTTVGGSTSAGGSTTVGGSTSAGASGSGLGGAIRAGTAAMSSVIHSAQTMGNTGMDMMRFGNNMQHNIRSGVVQKGADMSKGVVNSVVRMAGHVPMVGDLSAMGGAIANGGIDVKNTMTQAGMKSEHIIADTGINAATSGMNLASNTLKNVVNTVGEWTAKGADAASNVGSGALKVMTGVSNKIEKTAQMGANVATSMSGRMTSGAGTAASQFAGTAVPVMAAASQAGTHVLGTAGSAVSVATNGGAQLTAAVPNSLAASMSAGSTGPRTSFTL